MRTARRLTLAAPLVAALVVVPTATAPAAAPVPVTRAQNERVPEGASWTQHYVTTADGAELHADVLLPEGLAPGQRVPVILSAGPYFGYSGAQTPEQFEAGPSDRFTDLLEGGDVLERGYALVYVDTRGFGGSTGCPDFAGQGERLDVQAAIDWAAAQPWSTGSVGMYGKSYDAITGLIGNDLRDDDLKAVVAQEPVWDMYRNIHANGIPRTTSIGIPSTYSRIAVMPQPLDAGAKYLRNAAYELTHPTCIVDYVESYQNPDPSAPEWRPRDLAADAAGTDTPLFITQGFLEWNTDAEGVEEFLTNHTGPERGWLGQWDHVRGNDTAADGRLAMGRAGWFEEVMSFYDEHLKGIAPTGQYPAFSVQDSTGAWRAQDTWPVVEETTTLDLRPGSYTDDGSASSYWNVSAPLTSDTRITGTPEVSLDTAGNGQTLVRLYDVAPDGTAVMFDEEAAVLVPGTTSYELRSTDWILPTGHTLAVEVGTVHPFAAQPSPAQQALTDAAIVLPGDWMPSPSGQVVDVTGARLELDLDDPADDQATQGDRSVYLDQYLTYYTEDLPAGGPTFRVADGS